MEESKTRRLMKNTFVLSIRMLVTMALSFYSSRLILQALGIVDFGVFNVVCGVTAMITIISNSLTEGVNRFISIEVSKQSEFRVNKVFALSNTAMLIITLLFLILAESIGLYLFYQLNIPESSLSAAMWIYQFSVLNMVVSFNGIPYVGLIVACEKFGFYGIASILESILRLFVTAFLFFLPQSDRLLYYGLGLLLVAIAIRFSYVFYVFRIAPFIQYRFSVDRQELKSLGLFTSYKLLWEVAYTCGTQGVNIVLNLFGGPVLNAARSVSTQVQNMLYKLLLNFQTPLRPQIIKSYAEGERQSLGRLVECGIKVSYCIFSFLLVPIVVHCRQLLSYWLVDYPAETVAITQLLCFEALFYAIFLPLETALDAVGEIKNYKIGQSFVYFLILPVSYIALLMGFNYTIPFFLAIIAQMLIVGYRIVYICPKIEVKPVRYFVLALRLMAILSFSFIVAVVVTRAWGFSPVTLVIDISSNIIVTLLLMYYFVFDTEELRVIYNVIGIKKQFFLK